MKWLEFHHPDISLPVIKRRIGLELVEMLELVSLFLSRGGWALVNQSCYPDRKAYRNATYRLRKAGLIVERKGGGKTPRLVLSESGQNVLPAYFDPEKYWSKKWNGYWYLFVYDVPEVDRSYRDVLRRFLKQQRLGCLQQSVWVTPWDIRPQFDDLVKGASVASFAYLFESRTVLGLPSRRVVEDAWNFDRIYEIQSRYCDVTRGNLGKLESDMFERDDLATLMRLALSAYHVAFVEDPLMPRTLLPHGYQGFQALALHRQLLKTLGEKLWEGV